MKLGLSLFTRFSLVSVFFIFQFQFLEVNSHSDAVYMMAFRNTRRPSNVRVLFLFLVERSPQTLKIRLCKLVNQPVEKQS